MPIHRRKWWIRKLNEVADKQREDQEKVVRMPQSQGTQNQSLRARNIGR